jgi:aryl-alcohol dehydrogenase-like predicted oxidoreductase/RimJ/RimL family protein N-acetyltransferase
MKIITKNYTLKKMTIELANKNYLKWFYDEKIIRYIDSTPKNLNDLKVYIKKNNKDSNTFFWAIFKNKKHIGNIKIFEIDFKKKLGRLGILIGEKKYRNIGLGKEVIEGVKKYLLKKNILHLWLGVEKNNLAAINSYEKSGFFKYKFFKNHIYMKCNLFTSKLILGGAQLNSNYGITNFKNNIQSSKETLKIINLSKKQNIFHIDGAESYELFRKGNLAYLKNLKIDTKILLKEISSYSALESKIKKKYLDKNIKIDTLLIHDGDKIMEKSFKKKINILYNLKRNNIVSKVGISIYNFRILKKVISKFNIDVIQIPYNLVDRRIEKYRKILHAKNILLYARSIFLQGSLLKKVKQIKELTDIYEKVRKFTKKTKQTNLHACLNFVLNNDLIDKIIVGVRNSEEMNQLINFKLNPKISSIKFSKNEKLFAYNPSKWK